MSFFHLDQKRKKSNKTNSSKRQEEVSLELAYQHGCKVCPSNNDSFLASPKMKPSGSDIPLIYILGEAPGEEEDEHDIQFTGKSGQLLRGALEEVFGSRFIKKKIRFNNCVRCRPYEKKKSKTGRSYTANRTPTLQEISCCKKYIEEDIEKTKPDIIIGTGNIPLNWVIKSSGILTWRGRKIPVKIGKHTAWYFPIIHPAFLVRKGNIHDNEFMDVFYRDLENIKIFITNIEKPEVIDKDYTKGIEYVLGTDDRDIDKIKKHLRKFKKEKSIAIDIETSGLEPWKPNVDWLSVAVGTEDRVFAFPIDHPEAWQSEEQAEEIKVLFKRFLLNSGIKAAHNLKFELKWFNHYYGQDVLRKTKWGDTMAQAYVLDERSEGGMLSLDTQCLLHFGFNLKQKSNVDVKNILACPLKDLLIYNGMDVKYTHKLYKQQDSLLPRKLKKVVTHHNETAKTLALTESVGIPINLNSVNRISNKLTKEIKEIEDSISNLPEVKKFKQRFGQNFKHSSNTDLVKMFRDILKLSAVKKTSKGNYSTDNNVLEEFAKRGVKLAKLISNFRELAKLKSTYVDSIPKLTDDDGKLRTNFIAMHTATGRFSSRNPNMQNFPKRRNSFVRKMFVAPKGHKIVAIDYGQLEARVIVMVSGETNIIEHDVHMDWALRILDIYPEVVKVKNVEDVNEKALKKFRRKVKNGLVFPWFYGANKNTVARGTGLPDWVVDILHKDFWEYFSRVGGFHNDTREHYDKKGYVETLTGRRRRAPLSHNMIINSPIQGAASDIVVSAMNRLSLMAYEQGISYYQAVLNIHDDLTFIIPDEKLDEAVKVISREMVREFDFMNDVPLEVEVIVGKNWYKLEEYGKFSSKDFQ
jgi:DNA polymerase-1